MGPVPRERYNAKARKSQAGSHKRKKGKLSVSEEHSTDVNTLIHVPKSKDEREADRKAKLRQELTEQPSSKWNSKKKKRLEKYIEKKLKKEDRVQILEKLSQSQAQISSSLHLQSSSTLGTGKVITHQESADKLEDKEVRRALDGRVGKRKRRGEVYDVIDESNEDEDDEYIEILETGASNMPLATVAVGKGSLVEPNVGGALKRDADGHVFAQKARQTGQKTKSIFAGWKKTSLLVPEESDSSFDSSASESEGESRVKAEQDEDEDEEGDSGQEEEEEDDDMTDDDEDMEGEVPPPTKARKSLGFKDWALKQLNIAKGYEYSSSGGPDLMKTTILPPSKKQKLRHSSSPQEIRGPLGEDLQLPRTAFAAKLLSNKHEDRKGTPMELKYITVSRPPDVEEARLLLPIVAEEQPIMEAILLNPVVVICGETGSGKTTQIPQFLYEAGFGSPGSEHPGMIGITQPRRVAAMSMAARVGHELSLTSSKVSHQVRYDVTVSPNTSIKFMTEGVLLKELAGDFLLTKYSVIILDEAHERNINTDILIGVLSRVVKLREDLWKEGKEGTTPLRLIIMSATLRVSDFAENKSLFAIPPPVINVNARQHPVTIHFNRRTVADYVTEAIRKTIKIHTRLPPGGILIFLTGQNEINGVCRKLEVRFGKKAVNEGRKRETKAGENVSSAGQTIDRVGAAQADVEPEEVNLGESRLDHSHVVDDGDEPEDPDALDSEEEQQLNEELGLDVSEVESPMHILPLYSLLPADKQMQVFRPPPPGSRLVVVATNVAETSLTIPGIRYVVDCGRAKERHYDTTSGVQTFQVDWVSKASAAQRAGRAGRTGPGHCYRLYSSALYEHSFQDFSKPEILRAPIEGVVLQMKSMNIDAVVNFPFPTPPDRSSLRKAETILSYLGALDKERRVTEMGRSMSLFPVAPRFSRMLVSGQQHGCLPYVIAIVSTLSVGDPFLHVEALLPHDDDENDESVDLLHLDNEKVRVKEASRLRRKSFHSSQQLHSSLGNYSSDIFKMLSVVGAYEYSGGGHQFCTEHFVRLKAMEEVHKLRAQISAIVQSSFSAVDASFVPNLRPPSDLQLKVLRQLLCAAFIDQVAVRKDRLQPTTSGSQYASSQSVPYKATGIAEDVYIHPSSVLSNVPPPEFIVFTEVIRTSRLWIKGLTVINPAWLSSLGKSNLCTYSKPFRNSANVSMVIPHFGPDGWELPPVRYDTVSS
ncbi:P-loop containing nucleoside triphosphate hydrolase protein [Marasmius fiardii PR-910]|nr:P-loop containing nucleoside triphosphate hydrolase protein [Marasmius fiardii PR-910]